MTPSHESHDIVTDQVTKRRAQKFSEQDDIIQYSNCILAL